MFTNEYMAGPFQTSRYIGAIQNSFASLVVESKQKCENTVIKIKMQMQLSVPTFAHCAFTNYTLSLKLFPQNFQTSLSNLGPAMILLQILMLCQQILKLGRLWKIYTLFCLISTTYQEFKLKITDFCILSILLMAAQSAHSAYSTNSRILRE